MLIEGTTSHNVLDLVVTNLAVTVTVAVCVSAVLMIALLFFVSPVLKRFSKETMTAIQILFASFMLCTSFGFSSILLDYSPGSLKFVDDSTGEEYLIPYGDSPRLLQDYYGVEQLNGSGYVGPDGTRYGECFVEANVVSGTAIKVEAICDGLPIEGSEK